jgi:hypothetical protein
MFLYCGKSPIKAQSPLEVKFSERKEQFRALQRTGMGSPKDLQGG